MFKSTHRTIWLISFLIFQAYAYTSPVPNKLRVLTCHKGAIYCHCVMQLSKYHIPSNWIPWGRDNTDENESVYWITKFILTFKKYHVDIPYDAVADINNVNKMWITVQNQTHFTIHLHGSQTGNGYDVSLKCAKFSYLEKGAHQPWTGYAIISRYVHLAELTNVNELTTYHGFGY